MTDVGLTAAEKRVLNLISTDEIAALALSLVQVPGGNPPGGEGPRAELLKTACQERGLDCQLREVEPGRPNLSASLPADGTGDGPGLLFLGHTDVVPIGAGWTEELAAGKVLDGRLYGRGSADMLGGLAACVVAMSALREAGASLSGPVELASVMDEEETGKGIRHYLRDHDRSHFAGCIVAEPTDLQTIIAARGDAYLEFRVHGRAAHSGNPADGANAIHGAAAIIGEIERWNSELATRAHPLAGPATWSVGQIRGGTGTSIIPAECLVIADRRLLPAETGDVVLADVGDRVDALRLGDRGLKVEIVRTMEMPGFETPPDHPVVVATAAAVATADGPRRPLGGWTAACDGGFIARDAGVPVVVLGPGSVTGQAHRADESVALEELLVAARSYALTALRLLGGWG